MLLEYSKCCFTSVKYRVLEGESSVLGERSVDQLQYYQEHLYPKLNDYGDNDRV